MAGAAGHDATLFGRTAHGVKLDEVVVIRDGSLLVCDRCTVVQRDNHILLFPAFSYCIANIILCTIQILSTES